jgi:hypothetical protein
VASEEDADGSLRLCSLEKAGSIHVYPFIVKEFFLHVGALVTERMYAEAYADAH